MKLTVRVAGVLGNRHPDEEAAPSDRRERIVDSGVDRIVHVIDGPHPGWSDERRQEHEGVHGPPRIESCLKSRRILIG